MGAIRLEVSRTVPHDCTNDVQPTGELSPSAIQLEPLTLPIEEAECCADTLRRSGAPISDVIQYQYVRT